MNARKRDGFSMVEVMMVVATLAILAAVVLPQVQRFLAKSRRTEGIMIIQGLVKAEETYFAEYKTYSSSQWVGGIVGGTDARTGFSLSSLPKYYKNCGHASWDIPGTSVHGYHAIAFGSIDSDPPEDKLMYCHGAAVPWGLCLGRRDEIVIYEDDILLQ